MAMAVMALILVLMPVSYRAGTAQVHPHTVFQVVIDQVRGQIHTHTGGPATVHAHHEAEVHPAVYLALSLPLPDYASLFDPSAAMDSMLRSHRANHNSGTTVLAVDPDLPQLTSLHGVPEVGTGLTHFALSMSLLLLMGPLRRLWFPNRILHGIREAVDRPPPRVVGA